MLRPHRRLALAVLIGLALPGLAGAEATVELRVERGPYYAGVPIQIHVIGDGFAQDPEPTCSVGFPIDGQLLLTGIVPKFSSSVQVVGGRVFKSRTASYTCQYELTTDRIGSVQIGPFEMEQAGISRSTERHRIKVEAISTNARVRIRLGLPDTPVYVGQQVPIRVEWWLDQELAESVRSYTIRSELFDRDDVFDFIADAVLPANSRDQALHIQTPGGELPLKAEVEELRDGGTSYLVVVAERTLVPLRAGEYDLVPATVQVEEVTRWQRDLFGGRRPASTRRVIGRDQQRRLVVKKPPAEGRPESFAGAVGRGFGFEVSADRSVVQLGDPITLTLEVRGGGNLANVGLPDLRAGGGLDPAEFRLPTDDVSGELNGDTKRFRVSVRVIDDAVDEIPALAYSWFDPELGRYETTYSRPIALAVRAAEVITADDVLGAAPRAEAPEASAPSSTAEAEAPKRGSLSLIGADLSIDEDRARLRVGPARTFALEAGAYLSSLLILAAALFVRARNAVPAAVQRKRALLREQSQRIRKADRLGRDAGIAEIAGALRELASATGKPRSAELDAFLQECDALVYSPSPSHGASPSPSRGASPSPSHGADAGLEAEWTERAMRLVGSLRSELE